MVNGLKLFGMCVPIGRATQRPARTSSGAHSSTLDVLSLGVVAARVVQTSAHLSSGSNAAIAVRFTFLCVQLVAFMWMGALVVLLRAE